MIRVYTITNRFNIRLRELLCHRLAVEIVRKCVRLNQLESQRIQRREVTVHVELGSQTVCDVNTVIGVWGI